jgi:glutathione S-transferase
MRKLLQAWLCPFSTRARIALDEAQIPFEPVEINLRHKPAALLEASPKGQVPVLLEGDTPIAESLVICEYADELSEHHPLLPGAPIDHARERLWAQRVSAQLSPPFGRHAHAADEVAAARALAELQTALEALEANVPEEGFLAGAFSLADAVAAPFVLRLPKGLGALPPRLAAYAERLRTRPAIVKHTAPRPPPGWPAPLAS